MKDYALKIAGARVKWGENDPRTQALIMDARLSIRDDLAYTTRIQRDWQAKASRRVQRNRFSDSWTAREKYMACNHGYRDWRTYLAALYAADVSQRNGFPTRWHKRSNCGTFTAYGRTCSNCTSN